jgi:hypothetical protein
VIPAGLVLLAAGCLLGARTGAGDGYGYAALWLTLTGLGFGTAVVPATSLVMGSLPADRAGQGTSVLETVQQVGGVLGVAGLGSLLSAGYLARLAVPGLPHAAAGAARDSVTGADTVAARLHDPALLDSAHGAFTHGMSLVLLTCGAFALVAALLGALFLPAGTPSPSGALPAERLAGPNTVDTAIPAPARGSVESGDEDPGVAVGSAEHGQSLA